MQKITELNQPLVVGEFYLVPCLPLLEGEKEPSVPVIADFHKDEEIGAFVEHIHPDFRFFDNREYSRLVLEVAKQGESLHTVIYLSYGDRRLVWEKRKCFRDFPDYPVGILDVDVIETLELIYGNSKLNCGICPHKGANLNSIAPDKHGNKVCPLHNLMWDKDGNLVRRFGD